MSVKVRKTIANMAATTSPLCHIARLCKFKSRSTKSEISNNEDDRVCAVTVFSALQQIGFVVEYGAIKHSTNNVSAFADIEEILAIKV